MPEPRTEHSALPPKAPAKSFTLALRGERVRFPLRSPASLADTARG